jgi:hypothetical protein
MGLDTVGEDCEYTGISMSIQQITGLCPENLPYTIRTFVLECAQTHLICGIMYGLEETIH